MKRCVICGKFVPDIFWKPELCDKHEKQLSPMFKLVNDSIFELEQTLRKYEHKSVCRPLYRMRCNLGEIEDRLKRGVKICDYVTTLDLIGRLR